MSDGVSELTIPDVLNDLTKNLCNNNFNSDDENSIPLTDSLYYTESDFVNYVKTQDIRNISNLTLITINIANLLSKLKFLKIFLNNITTINNQPDIIVVVETHISEVNNSGYNQQDLRKLIPGYNFYHKGRSVKKGGGVGIFVNEKLDSETEVLQLARFREEHFENIIIKLLNIIKNGNENCSKSLTIAAIYRQPNTENYELFIKELEAVLKKIDKNSNEVIFTGDFNLDLLKSNSHPTTATYLDLMVQHGFSPKIVRPTRIKKQSATLIDHIFTRENPNFIKSGIINTEIAGNCGYTDHFPIFTTGDQKAKSKR